MLPFMRSKNATKEYSITKFGGINKSFSQGINEFSDGYNMTSEFFPALSSVRGNEVFEKTQNVICGAGFYDKLYTLVLLFYQYEIFHFLYYYFLKILQLHIKLYKYFPFH